MRKLFVVFALLILAVAFPAIAQDEDVCDIAAPAAAAEVDMIGWTYPIIDYYAQQLESCNDVENLEVNTQLLDSGSAHDQIRLAFGAGGEAPYGIVMVTGRRCELIRR